MTNDEVGDIAEIYLEDVNNDDAEKLGEMGKNPFWDVSARHTMGKCAVRCREKASVR